MPNTSCINGTFHTLTGRAVWSLLLVFCLWNALVTSASAAIDPVNLLGRYERDAPASGSHQGNLTWHPTEPGKMRWTNDDGGFWSVTPDFVNGVLVTEADYPYAQTAPNMPMQFHGAAGASAVDSFQINGETYSRKFSIRNDYANNTTNSHYMIRGPFVVWWEFGQDLQANATDFLGWAEQVRNDQWAWGMLDMTSIRAGYHQNIYLTREGNAFGWSIDNTVHNDSYGCPRIFMYSRDGGTFVHEAFHAVQFSDNSGHYGSIDDTLWFLEATAVWYPGSRFGTSPDMSGTVSVNPHLPLWATWDNVGQDDVLGNTYRVARTYGLGHFLAYLTNVKAVPSSLIANFYATDTPITPQQYLYNQIGPANFRQYFTEWTAKDAACQDYLSRSDWARATAWLGDQSDAHRYIQTYTDSGTNGAWVSPPANLAPRGWSYNVFRVINSYAATYTLQLNGNATGTAGTPSVFTGTAVVMNPAGNQYYPFAMNSNTQGNVSLTVPASATEIFFVIDAVPAHFNGNQQYPYHVKIDRNAGRTSQLITAGSTWKYSATGTAAPANWAQLGFTDAAWSSGPGMLGTNISGRTPATTITNTSAITTYYRHSFTVDDPSQFQKLILKLLRDDGAVVWLNGVELHRSNMPAGTINSTTPALGPVADADEAVIHTSRHILAANSLVAGTNVIAVELHQAGASTGDLGFDLSLDAESNMPSNCSYGGQPAPFTITATDQWRALGDNLGTFQWPNASIYWRDSASDATYMHFDLSSLAGGTISSNVSLSQTVDAQYGGQINGGRISTANAPWSGLFGYSTPGFTAIGDSALLNGNFATGSTATWMLSNATFQGFLDDPASFHGLVLSGASGSKAHFSGAPTLTGTVTTGRIVLYSALDWRTASFEAGTTTLSVSGSNNVTGGNVVIQSGATLSVLDAATLDSGVFFGTFANNDGTLAFGSSAAQSLHGVISGSGGLVKSGNGILTLSGANTYTGFTSLNAGTLRVANSTGLGGGGFHGNTMTLIANNAALELQGDLIINEHFHMRGAGPTGQGVLRSLSGNSSLTTNFALDGDSTFGVDSGTLSIAAGIYPDSGTPGLTKIGAGTLVLAAANTYTGATTVTEGTLSFPIGGGIGSSAALNVSAGAQVDSFGNSQLPTSGWTIAGTVNKAVAWGQDINGAVTLNSGTLSGADTGAAALSWGQFHLAGATFTTTGASIISASHLGFAGATFSPTGLSDSLTISSIIGTTEANSGALVKTGLGTVTLSGANAYTGATTVTEGTLSLPIGGGIGSSTALNVSAGAQVDSYGNSQLPTSGWTIAGTVNKAVAWGQDINGAVTLNGGTLSGADTGAAALSYGQFTLIGATFTTTGASTINASHLGFAGAAFSPTGLSDTLTISSIIGTTSLKNGALVKTGLGTVILSGANTYTGATTVSSGTLALVGGSQSSPITVSSGASLGFTLGSPTASTSSFNLMAGTVKITGTPTLPSYTLISSSTGITGTPTLHAPITGYQLAKVGNTLVLSWTPYTTWLNFFPLGNDASNPAGDNDNDGMNNLLEYALNGNPSTSDPSIQPDLALTATHFEFTYSRLDLSRADTTQTFEYGNNLSGWTPVIIPVGPGVSTVGAATVTIADTGTTDSVKIRIPKSVNPSGTLFGRLKVVK